MFDLQKFNSIHGWFTEGEGSWLYQSVLGNKRVLEIGAWRGRSTFPILSALRDSPGSPDEKVLVSVDPYTAHPCPHYKELQTEKGRQLVMASFLSVVEQFRGKVKHLLLQVPSSDAYPKLRKLKFPLFDMTWIDGDHSEEAVTLDIIECLKLTRPGGYICGHDYRDQGNPGVRKAVDALIPEVRRGAGSIWHWQLPAS